MDTRASSNASALNSTVRTAASSKGVPVERIFRFVGVGVKVVFCLPGSTTRTGILVAVCCCFVRCCFAVALAALGAARDRLSFGTFRCASAETRALRAFTLAWRYELSELLGFWRAPGRLRVPRTPYAVAADAAERCRGGLVIRLLARSHTVNSLERGSRRRVSNLTFGRDSVVLNSYILSARARNRSGI